MIRNQHSMRFATPIIAVFALLLQATAAPVDFSREVLPIFSDKCYKCHGPDPKKRKADLRLDTKEGALRTKEPVIVPRKSRESELVRRISTSNPDDLMPPPDSNRTLTKQEISLLTRWVDEGANWGMHWAFVAPKNQAPPVTKSTKWSRDPLDKFVLARLQKEKLKPAPEATKETWLRRVSLDLTGIPPTPKEVDDFLADKSKEAYEKVTDRLLASPRFGERMAVDWLDLARFADTHGYQVDRYRPVWAYRDWVIQAFNQNLPYDKFVTWQVAGDLLPNATREQRLATTFNRLHNQNEEGGIVPEEFRVAYVVDRVNTFSMAFLGLTTECARCHDHKFDPITQRDFYSLFAFFQNIDESGQSSYFTEATPVPALLLSTPDQDKKIADLKQRIADKEGQLLKLREQAQGEFSEWLGKRDKAVPAITNLIARYAFDEIVSNQVVNLVAPTNHAKAVENPQLIDGKFGRATQLSGENGFTFGKIGSFNRADPFTFSLWVRTPSHAPRFVVLHHSKASADAASRGYELLLEEGKVAFGLYHMWPGNSLKVAGKNVLPTNEWVHVAVSYDGSSRAQGVKVSINGAPAETEVIRDALSRDITYENGEPELAIGYRFRDAGFKGGAVDELQVFDRALTPIEMAQLAGGNSLTNWLSAPSDKLDAAQRAALFDYFFANHFAPAQKTLAELHALRDEQTKFVNQIPEIMTMQEMSKPKPAFVLKRGAYDAPGEPVLANTPASLPHFPPGEETNRLGLAKWLLLPEHPLTARVTVNRFWQMMFGRGIVETSDNFGSQGSQPTHPELLDWLARDFIASGWDVKLFLRKIALSATYRQSSHASPELLARDPHNELLARGPSRRLTAEMIRDQALALSDLLVEKIGGPSVKPYQPEGLWLITGSQKYEQGHGDDLHRRSLYTFWKRTVPPPAMATFDAVDRSYCTARRQNTSTPLQSLALLNDIQIVEAARLLSQRMLREGGATSDERINWVFRVMTSRKPSAKELVVLKKLFAEQHEYFRGDASAVEQLLKMGEAKNDAKLDPVELAAGTVLAQALFNYDETVMRR